MSDNSDDTSAPKNTTLWNQLCRVPPEHLKSFTRAGGFKGTAIKPMWSIHRMTEIFGPCGQGWGIEQPQFEPITAGEDWQIYQAKEAMRHRERAVWYLEKRRSLKEEYNV